MGVCSSPARARSRRRWTKASTSRAAWRITRAPSVSLSWAHPPLGNALAALPIVLHAPAEDIGALPGFAGGAVTKVTRELLLKNYSAHRPWFFEARAAVAVMALALGAYLYRWALALFGARVAVLTLFFYVMQPTLIAHGRLMTTDFPVAAAMTVAICELARFLAGDKLLHGALFVVFSAIAVSTKYTGLALGPIAVSAVLCCAVIGAGRYAGLTRAAALGRAFVLLALLGVGCLFVVNLAYRFEDSGMTVEALLARPEPQDRVTKRFGGRLLDGVDALRHLPGWLPVPLPYTYAYGVMSVGKHDSHGHPSVFFGKANRTGDPTYFPVMLAIKTPALLLVALGCALYVFAERRGRVSLPTLCCAWFCVALLLLSMRASINIGIRHILPILPLLALFGAQGAVAVYDLLPATRMRGSARRCSRARTWREWPCSFPTISATSTSWSAASAAVNASAS